MQFVPLTRDQKEMAEGMLKAVLCVLHLSHFVLLPVFAVSNDITALLAFKSRLSSASEVTSTWDANKVDTTGCPFQWHGVTCFNGTVNSLSLEDLAIAGEIATGTLGRLSKLSSLSIVNNSFTGRLPADLGDLSSLQMLAFSNNLFTGSIPDSFGNLKNLRNLSLSSNNLEGPIPDVFNNMTQLLDLDFSTNHLSGGIPPTIGKLQQLVSLNLSWNNLNGSLPSNLRNLEALQKLDLHRNKLSGQLDPVLMGLRRMQQIDFSCNQLSGLLPWQQGAPFVFPQDIVSVNLSFNQLSGELAPENAASLFASKLQILDISSNLLSGKLPSFEFVFSLRVLRLQNNSFIGFVPRALLSEESMMEELDLSMNNLTGNIETIGSFSLSILKLSSNGLSGSLPIRLGSCGTVDLSSNLFSGDLSVMRSWGDRLEILDLSNNSLTGVVPNETTNLLRLMYLNLSHNSLSGSLPSSYASFRKLTTLDLSFNTLNGEIPGAFFHSASLSTLRLSHNQLVGGIPVNSFLSSSAIPGELLSPTSTVSVPAAIIFSPLQILDLSWNRMNGSIPQEIASLTTLVVLNLSRNNFSGAMPSQLSLLRYLEDLDLSFNHLTGHIPSQLPSSLQRLNLSNNALSGVIPVDLLKRFPLSSFFPGNPGLRVPENFGSGPATHSRRHKRGLSPAVKAGLIGGCIAAAALTLAAALFIYYRNRSRFEAVGKGFEKPRSPQRGEIVAQADPGIGYSSSVSFSREQLLPGHVADAGLTEQQARNVHLEGLDLTKKPENSPSRRRSRSQTLLLEEGPPSLEHSPSLKVRSPDKLAGDLFLLDDAVVFTPEELSSAPAEVLGRSSHGTSYKATLDSGHVLTVKWLREGLAKNKKAFTSEARKFGSIHHPNIVPLRGYYWGPREHEKLIIWHYISFGSLAERLSERTGRRFSPLDWSQRVRIAVDIARGLSYLHLKHRLPHGNLKATNVLLDGPGLTACLSDYSIHRLMTPAGTANQILNAGALGYRAPELANARKPKPTLKADVYAFGVILMEIVTGKGAGDIISGNSGAVDLNDWVKLLVTEGRAPDCYDKALVGYDRDQEPPRGIDEILALALRCISERSERPTIKAVVDELFAIAME